MDNMPKKRSPHEIMRSISKLADEAQMNKSFGLPEVTKDYQQKLAALISELSDEEVNEIFGIGKDSDSDLKKQIAQLKKDKDAALKLVKKVKPVDILREIIDNYIETGLPYVVFKDTINRLNVNKHDGMIYMTNLCVAPETKILTSAGNIEISKLVDKPIYVWNGQEWSSTKVIKTGQNQKLLKVTAEISYLNNSRKFTRTLECTPYHKWFLEKEGKTIKCETQELKIGDKTIVYSYEDDPELLQAEIIKIEDTGRISDTFCFKEPLRNMGVFNDILTGQCVESFSNFKEGEYAHCCNLLHVNLANVENFEELEELSKWSIYLLDRMIDLTVPPIEEAKAHNERYRTIGQCTIGLADWLAKNDYNYYTGREFIAETYERLALSAIEASSELAAEKGSYPAFEGSEWDRGNMISKPIEWYEQNAKYPERWKQVAQLVKERGIRNSELSAVAPNTSSSLVQGCCASFLPPYQKIFRDKSGKGSLPQTPQFIEDKFMFYTENLYFNQELLAEITGRVIQPFITAGISMEGSFGLEKKLDKDGKERVYEIATGDLFKKARLRDFIIKAWKEQCKAIYYIRTNTKEHKEECSMCAG